MIRAATRSSRLMYGSRCRRSLPPVAAADFGGQGQRLLDPVAFRAGQGRCLDGEPFAEPGLAVERGDRVQRHCRRQPPLGRVDVVRGRWLPFRFCGVAAAARRR